MGIQSEEEVVRGRIRKLRREGKVLVLNENDFEVKVELELKGVATTRNGQFEVTKGFLSKVKENFNASIDKASGLVVQNLLSGETNPIVLPLNKIAVRIFEKTLKDIFIELDLSSQAENEAKLIVSTWVNIAIKSQKH